MTDEFDLGQSPLDRNQFKFIVIEREPGGGRERAGPAGPINRVRPLVRLELDVR